MPARSSHGPPCTGVLCAPRAHGEPLSLKLSREIDVARADAGGAGHPRDARRCRGAAARRRWRRRAARCSCAPTGSKATTRAITAEGNVELRTRRETVLADRLSYAIDDQTIHGEGNVVLRRGFDWITGPQLQYKRDTEVGLLSRAAIFRRRGGCAWRRGRDPLHRPRSLRGDRRELHDVRRAAPRLVSARRGARGRQPAQGRHRAARVRALPRRARAVCAVAAVPAVQRAQVRIPDADARLDRRARLRGDRAVLPQPRAELRRDDHAAPDDQARADDRRAVPLPASATTTSPLGDGERRDECRNPAARSRDRASSRYALAWTHNEQFAPWLARLLEPQPASPTTSTSPISPTASPSRRRRSLPREAGLVATSGPWSVLARVQSFQTLQDPNAPVDAAVQPACRRSSAR